LGSGLGAKWKGQAQLIALFLILALVPTTVIVAQNVTNSAAAEGMVTGANFTEPLPSDDTLNETLLEVPEDLPQENATLLEENTTEPENNATIPQDNETSIAVPEENVTVPEDDETAVNETNVTLPDENVTLPDENVTIPDENVTVPDENVTEPEINVTEPEDNETETNVTEEPLDPEITLVIENPEKVTRDTEDVTIGAVITNAGGTAYNLTLEWILPPGFIIVDGDSTMHAEALVNSETFTAEIKVFPVIQMQLGPAEIKARVSYE
jgi:hypothetical protein